MNNTKKLPRVMFAAPKSGSGKTIITCGFLSYLKNSGKKVTAYKCGPDYIDPMFHRNVIGVEGGNLDTYFADPESIGSILWDNLSDVSVFEGVMGIYDGLGGTEIKASSYDLARTTDTPIVLVIDGHGMGRTIISLIKGILADDTSRLIKGVIINRTSAYFYRQLYPALEEVLLSYGARPLGFIPKLEDISLESRHLGLKMPEEVENLKEQVLAMERVLRENCDLDAIEDIMSEAAAIREIPHSKTLNNLDTGLCLAVARDEAFCFYYGENLKLFNDAGVEIKTFSPVHDGRLPEGIDGILLGGGYPELYLRQLSENKEMLAAVKGAIEAGMPSLAECGGFMYLHKSVADEAGELYELASVIDGSCQKKDRLVRFGYMEIDDCVKAELNGIRGHEFHYYDSSSNGNGARAKKPVGSRAWECLHVGDNYVWGFPHFYYPSNPKFVEAFIASMRSYHKKNKEQV